MGMIWFTMPWAQMLERRHCHFKCFFAIQDPRIATPSRKSHPNWKVEPLLKQALRVSKEAVIPGQDAAIDKQMIVFQGACKDKKRISEKREGDGFQSDSVNVEGGYTWVFSEPASSSQMD